MPLHMDYRSLGTFAEDRDGIPVLEHSQEDYNRSTVLSIDTTDIDRWSIEGSIGVEENISFGDGECLIIGLASSVDDDSGENMTLDYVCYESEGNACYYTLREYAQALRDYYALVDPLPFKAAWDGFEDDYTNAKKELKGAEELVSSELSRLKGAQKDYEEAVALYGVNNALPEQTSADPFVFLTSEITDEEPVYTGEEFTEASAISTASTSLSETANTHNENATISVTTDFTPVTEKEESRSARSGYVHPASTLGAFTYINTVSDEETMKKTEEEQNGILPQVLSYIFNGGAIAIIIPAGFFRRKAICRVAGKMCYTTAGYLRREVIF